MKKIAIIISTLLIVIALSGCEDSESYPDEETLELIEENIVLDSENEDYEYTEIWGSVSALNTDLLTIQDMLVYAIQDEYSAYAEYDYILANFDVTKPFSNIINAEASHIEMLLPLFEVYEIEVPYNDAENHLLPVIDLTDTFRTGVAAEILNIDMYNLFLDQELPDDIKEVFIALRDASIKHLDAFQKNLDKNT